MSSKIADANKGYYSSKGKKIYADFSTFAQGKCLATCNAIEYCNDFSSRAEPVVVCEYGIGKGDFARAFLDEVKKRNKKLYAKTRYYLFDFSEKMLDDAKKNLKQHHGICIFGKFDALLDTPDLEFDYCRINELLTDLPASLYSHKEGKVHELLPQKDGTFTMNGVFSPNPLITAFMSRIEDGRAIPFNFDAQKFLLALCAKGKEKFRIDIFDYGFYSAEEVFSLPKEEWNRLMVRDYGGQLTVDLNFPQIMAALDAEGLPAQIEKQKFYCEKVTGKRLGMSHTKAGLDYLPIKKDDRFIEDDGFYHLRIGK
ncbi:Putative S-adenosyl-L-methionine-dependent methyltransferase [uncultured archaeon]|nr:Putative S-adenosyl-L-methionine-dependent methyltransferase [uncultured archaeon]